MKELVFVHGRAQENKDAVALKQLWVETFKRGLAKSGLALPVSEDHIHFPYYGQALHDLVSGMPAKDAARVVVKSAGGNADDELEFMGAVMREIQHSAGISDSQVREMTETAFVEKGPSEWVQGILAAVDRCMPGVSGATIALLTNDVWQYLRNPGLARKIDTGVRAAFNSAESVVVVSHSLGTVVAYNLLRREGEQSGWRVPLFVTLGSPLAVAAIRSAMVPISSPVGVSNWFNARDPRDLVALHPLDSNYFNVDPKIENKDDVDNSTPNHHGIVGYLDDQFVAKRIHDALVSGSE